MNSPENKRRKLAEKRRKYHTDPAYRQAVIDRAREWDRSRPGWRPRKYGLDPIRLGINARASAASRRARVKANMVERVDPEVVLIRDCGRCGICGRAVGSDWHLDHIVALVNGGEHSYRNVQVAHPLCNRRKATR